MKITLTLHLRATGEDIVVPAKVARLPDASYATSYGVRLPTSYMVLYKNRWRRVYCCQFSNAGTAYIGRWTVGVGADITVGE